MRGRKKDLEKENIEYETGPNLNAAGSGFFSMQPKKKKVSEKIDVAPQKTCQLCWYFLG